MINKRIVIDKIDMPQALRYLGFRDNEPEENMKKIISKCEKELIEKAVPSYVYKVFPIDKNCSLRGCDFELTGNDIKNHLKNCNRAVLMCVTLSTSVDMLIKQKQVTGMTEAIIIDALASAMVEQVCDKVEEIIKDDLFDIHKENYFTWRYGLGYGDFPLDGQKQFLNVLDAGKRVGVTVNDTFMLIPTKSVTCVIGVSESDTGSGKRSCSNCNMKDVCAYRNRGTTCR